MTPELYQRIKPIYEAALDMPADQRTLFVDEACCDDLELQEHLVELLAAHDERTGPLDAPLINLGNFFYPRQRTLADGALILDRFRIIRLLGWGGMGEVYEAEDRLLRGVNVALKTILPGIAGDPELEKRFEREVLLAREVAHPNLCPVHTIFRCDNPPPGFLFLTMKLLPGQTLAQRLREPARMTSDECMAVLRQASLGLAAIHAAGIIHRDIKPNNIMVDGSGPALHLWITDFGLARAYETEATRSTVGKVAGTPGYIAPELLLGHPPSQASDLYALGVVLHEVFAGEKPVPVAGTQSYTVSSKLNAVKAPALAVRLITECLQNDPERRCKAFADTLQIIEPKLDHSNYKTGAKTRFWTRRRFVTAAAASTCAVAGGAWWKRDHVEILFEDIFEPLPEKRYIVLLPWPKGESTAVVSTILTSIAQRLSRAEALVKHLFIITVGDLPDDTVAPHTPAEAVASAGANLVLAASLHSTPSKVWLTLQIIDAATERVYRKAHISCAQAALSTIATRACEMAARMIGIPDRQAPMKDSDEVQQLSPKAYTLFSEAEQLAAEPTSKNIETAILKYQGVVEIDGHFALGYAQLAIAYIKHYINNNNSAALDLAQLNATKSLGINAGSARGNLSQALVHLYLGHTDKALTYLNKSLNADPGNPETMLYGAQALKDQGQWDKAKQVYEEILRIRPNYWPAYNDLGWIFSMQPDYEKAAEKYRAATVVAPTAALPLANLGATALQLGDLNQAETLCKQSLKLDSNNEVAVETMGDIEFYRGHYALSLKHYQDAIGRYTRSHLLWRDIGDCYIMLGHPNKDIKECYTRAAALLSENLAINPRYGFSWATLAFYHAKLHSLDAAKFHVLDAVKTELQEAANRGADDVESLLIIAQTYALTNRKEDALNLVLQCLSRGLSPVEIGMALDLKDIRNDPKYISYMSSISSKSTPRRVF